MRPNDCRSARNWLRRSPDLGWWTERRLQRHLDACASCREVSEADARWLGELRSVADGEVTELAIDPRRVRALARQCADRVGPTERLRPRMVPALVMLGAAAPLLLSFWLLVPTALLPAASEESPLMRLARVDDDGAVLLDWEDTGKSAYKIYRSTSPSDFEVASPVVVRGTRWADPSGDDRVVFYRID